MCTAGQPERSAHRNYGKEKMVNHKILELDSISIFRPGNSIHLQIKLRILHWIFRLSNRLAHSHINY
jgi:hypothetical protein